MTEPLQLTVQSIAPDGLTERDGRIAVILPPEGRLGPMAARIDRAARKALSRLRDSEAWEKAKDGEAVVLNWPAGLMVEAVVAVKLDRKADRAARMAAGAAIAGHRGKAALAVVADRAAQAADVGYGLMLRAYEYTDQRSDPEARGQEAVVLVAEADVASVEMDLVPLTQRAAGVFMTRDLVNAPANVLTTTSFSDQLAALTATGLEVEVLEEDQLADLGMRLLLSVGQGSDSPSKVVVMRWTGGGDAAPLALVGKGVVFDTGGISLKPAGGMEDMTMDMGGAGTVAGVMKAIALRKARANVIGIVGLVENMPSGRATRPGDVVASMKGDTVEIINTDAEGRLVLADCLWHVQQSMAPAAIIDLATLTGAAIVALGHENAAVFSNDDTFCEHFLEAARAEGEGAWRLPLGDGYDKKLKSRIADMKNVGGRDAGSITAAQFLLRFVEKGMPWIHLDIAGTASMSTDTPFAPKGATGWGVRALDRLISDRFETDD